MNGNNIYFDRFEVKHNPKKIKEFIGNKNILTNIYRMFIVDPSVFDSLISRNEYEKDGKMIPKYSQ